MVGLVFIANATKEVDMRKKEKAAALNEQNQFCSFMKMLMRYFSFGWKWFNKTFF